MDALPEAYDIVVMGAGPAGAATALRAVELGHRVCLIERGHGQWQAPFCQSLATGVGPLLDALGIRDEVEAEGIADRSGLLALWESPSPRHRGDATAGSLHIERSVFDRILRDRAARAGAVLERATVVGAERSGQQPAAWLVRVVADGRMREISARALVDAAGRKPIVAAERTRASPPLVALLGVWQATDKASPRSIVEAGPDCWYWAGPQRGGRTTAAVFFDPRSTLFAKGASRATVYRALIGQSRLLRDMLGELLTPVIASDATTRHVRDQLQAGLVRVGESALSLDPLSSQGIQRGLTAALQSAVVLNTWLRRPERSGAADAFYRDRHAEAVQRAVESSGRVYALAAGRFATAFWRERSVWPGGSHSSPPVLPTSPLPEPSMRLRLADGVRVARAAVVRHDLAEFAPAIVGPGWERAVAFAQEQPVGRLASDLVEGTTAADLVRVWAGPIGEVRALQALAWMWQARVLATEEAIRPASREIA